MQFGQPGFAIADQITKALPPPIMAKDISVSGITDPAHERYKEAAEVRALIDSNPDVAKIYQTAKGLEGLIRNAGVHACAVIMSSEPLMDAIPVWKRAQDGAIITGWDYPSCEAIGLLKMDFLGLRNLTVIGDAIENIKANRGIDLDLDTLPLEDPKTYELLSRGDTLGVFQLDGGPMRDLLRRMQPTGFNDIVAVLALYRPGPMGMNAHNDYADRKNDRQPIKPIHPELEEPLRDILSETYGLIVYQEQIMFIAQKVAGYSMGRADALRRAMGKKKLEVLEAEYAGFRAGMTANGFSDAAVKALWDTILPFAGYAFNKSHAAGYGLVSFWTAYLKANYPRRIHGRPAHHVSATTRTRPRSTSRTAAGSASPCCRPTSTNPSRTSPPSAPTSASGSARSAMSAPTSSRRSSRRARRNRKFADFSDYLNKIDAVACTKKVTESLIKAGAFDSLSHPRKGLLLVHSDAIDAVMSTKKAEAIGQFDLFGGDDADEAIASVFDVKVPEEEWDSKHRLALEREMLGLYVSGHPLNGVEHVLAAQSDTAIPAILEGDYQGRHPGDRRRHPRLGQPAHQQERPRVGVRATRGSHRRYRGAVLPAGLLGIRDGRHRGRGGAREGPGVGARRSDLVDRQRSRRPRPVRRRRRETAGGEHREPDVHTGQGRRAQAGAHPPSGHLGRPPAPDHRRHRDARSKLDDSLRVTPSSALMGDLKALLGPTCLAI